MCEHRMSALGSTLALSLLLPLAMGIGGAGAIELQGSPCPPNLAFNQTTQFPFFSVMGICLGGYQILNEVRCTAVLTTQDLIQGGVHVLEGRPLPNQTVTFYAVRENGEVQETQEAITDLHGTTSVTFEDLPVTGSYNHQNCPATPSETWECYEFYVEYEGARIVGAGGCVFRTSCQSEHKYVLLEDNWEYTECGMVEGLVDQFGGVVHQLGVTLTVSMGSLTSATIVAISQPTPPPPLGIPPESEILDWRYIDTGGATFDPPATAALDFTDSIIYGHGRCGTMIYAYDYSRVGWFPVSMDDVHRSPMNNRIWWPLMTEGFYAMVGLDDGDLDGIEDLLEVQDFTTHPGLPDTDGDFIDDGEEVLVLETLPLIPDSDGDEFPDGDEVAAGTDPNDPRDYPGAIDRDEHDVGAILTSMTDKGMFGFVDPDSADGVGFIYPAGGGDNLLYIGGFWAGTDSTYLVNRDYAADTMDWEVAAHPDGHVVTDATGTIEQRIRSSYVDSPHPLSKWLRIYQESAAWSNSPDDTFILERFRVANEGMEFLSGLYLGQFLDFDIPAAPLLNSGRVDPERNLVYLWLEGSGPYAGVMLIEPAPAANLTLIHNPTYVWPTAHISDAEKYLFLTAADPEHAVQESWEANDWSILASAGPFQLAPGDSVILGLVLVAGATEEELLAHADQARWKYSSIYQPQSGLDDPPGSATRVRAYRIEAVPNPFSPVTTLRFDLPTAGRVSLHLYDLIGRRVRTLLDSTPVGAGRHGITWDGCNARGEGLPSRIYFYRFEVGNIQRSGRLILTK
ncbi:MAG: hypothetical protein ABIF09_15065 [Gemmatimonadota bacterium]